MADKLSYFQFRNTVNPFGVLFHPRAISQLLLQALDERAFKEEDCFYHLERWHSHAVHSELSRHDLGTLLHVLNASLKNTKDLLKQVTHLSLTLGTAWGYVKKEDRQWVANCHKVPQREFDKVLSAPDDIRSALSSALSAIYEVNPDISVILTVSPVRHVKDGFIENQRSKSHLFVALHQLLEEFAAKKIHYFPAYELMMDELRDYRFYEADMIHPNALATQYIWERFRDTCILMDDLTVMKKVEEVQRGLRHRPFHTASESYRMFRADLDQKINALQADFPHMRFDRD
jgi:hypothetical protein